MRVFAIGDPHLSFRADKPMDIFGAHWAGHPEKIRSGWRSVVREDDLVLVAGDISWSLKLRDADLDLAYFRDLPGLKLLTKGNHDHWWESTRKVQAALPPRCTALLNEAVRIGNLKVAAARGWDFPGSPDFVASEQAAYERELNRCRLALEAAGKLGPEGTLLLMLHYPPLRRDEHGTLRDSEFWRLAREAGATVVVHGHVHGPSLSMVVDGTVEGVRNHCVSVDHIDFVPRLILEVPGT